MKKQKNQIFIGFAFICIVSLFQMTISGSASKLNETDSAVKSQIAAEGGTKFTSVYTDTTKDCKGKEPVFTCKGYGGYRLVMDVGGAFQTARIESTKSDYSLPVAERQSVGWNPKIEWRMADGKPFAVIVRVDVNVENSTDAPKKIGEQLIVKGLKSFETIDAGVDAKLAKANEKAREIADKGFKKNDSMSDETAFTDGKTALMSGAELGKLKKINAAVAVPTYLPAGFKLKNVEIQEPEAHIVAFSIFYETADGKSFEIQSNNEALGDMAVKREVKFGNSYFLDSAQKTDEFYAGHDENDANTIASEWLCSAKKYQPKDTEYAQCFQLLSGGKSLIASEASKIMQSLRYLKR